jgi:hypothetical protein
MVEYEEPGYASDPSMAGAEHWPAGPSVITPCDDCDRYDVYDYYGGHALGPYLKAGPTLPFDEGMFAGGADGGWMITGGVRQRLGPELANSHFFFEMGGSYMSARGDLVQITPGEVVLSNGTTSIPFDEFASTRLTEVRRGGAHMAVGWILGSPLAPASSMDRGIFAVRFGGRLSHVRGEFEDTILPDPQMELTDNLGSTAKRGYGQTDTVGGLYLGMEMLLIQRDVSLGDLRLTIDTELAHDWIDFKNFEDAGLGTASILCGFSIAR